MPDLSKAVVREPRVASPGDYAGRVRLLAFTYSGLTLCALLGLGVAVKAVYPPE
jgi:hypothetical protein